MIDFVLLIVFGLVAWAVASEGPWGAAFVLLSVVIGGLLAMNFFEPVAAFLQQNVSSSRDWSYRWDIISLLGLFALFVFALRELTDRLSPVFIEVNSAVHEIFRWGCSLAAGYTVMAILLTALHTAPLPRDFIGFKPERKNFFAVAAPDRQWLGFTQYVSERVFQKSVPRIFDGPVLQIADQRNTIWPSFPIRYAARREEISATSAAIQTAPVIQQNTPQRSTGPSF